MPQNFFLKGEPKSGKTTTLKEIAQELKKHGFKVGGFISPEEKKSGSRTGFDVIDLENGKMAKLADVNGSGPKVGKYKVDIKSFESLAIPIMKKADKYDVMIIDEIGVMELKSSKFQDELDNLIEMNMPLIATVHPSALDKYSAFGEVLEITDRNRNELAKQLKEKVVKINKSMKKPMPVQKAKATTKKVEIKQVAKKEAPKRSSGGLLQRILNWLGLN